MSITGVFSPLGYVVGFSAPYDLVVSPTSAIATQHRGPQVGTDATSGRDRETCNFQRGKCQFDGYALDIKVQPFW